MPIHPDLRPLYPKNWRELSAEVRFGRAGGRCEQCGRPHLALVRVLPGGRWFDRERGTWRDGRGREARWPTLIEAMSTRETRVVLAAAHLDGNVRRRAKRNLRAWCQRCHILHDRPMHMVRRQMTLRSRWALGDLFTGPYVRAELVRVARQPRAKKAPPARPMHKPVYNPSLPNGGHAKEAA